MNNIEKLTEIFSQFPGIGQRQAKRIVYFLLTRQKDRVDEFIKYMSEMKKDVIVCEECMRFFQIKNTNQKRCDLCNSNNRNNGLICLVERDIDLESIERNSKFDGRYFVLGGSIPILDKEPEKRVKLKELENFLLKKKNELEEIIIATSWNPEGENTFDFIKKFLENFKDENKVEFKISSLGKGLSMGSELEYTDPDTLKNAFKNRK